MSLSIWLVTDASDTTWTVIAEGAADALAVATESGMDGDRPDWSVTVVRDGPAAPGAQRGLLCGGES